MSNDKDELVNMNLETKRVKDHLVNGSDIEVENSEMEALEAGHHFWQLLWPFIGQNFQASMAFNHGHFYVRH